MRFRVIYQDHETVDVRYFNADDWSQIYGIAREGLADRQSVIGVVECARSEHTVTRKGYIKVKCRPQIIQGNRDDGSKADG